MRLKPFVIAARLSERQYRKVEALAANAGLTRSEVVSTLVDSVELDEDLHSPIGNGAGHDLPVTSAVPA